MLEALKSDGWIFAKDKVRECPLKLSKTSSNFTCVLASKYGILGKSNILEYP